ncbi:MAG: accessory factor UbiK family protein [Alphaproteobacteria bacterium]
MQTSNKILDDLARVASGAVGAAAGLRGEAEALFRDRLRRLLGDMELVNREEFEAVRAMAAKARTEQEAMAKRIAVLEARIEALGGKPARKPVAGKKPAARKKT